MSAAPRLASVLAASFTLAPGSPRADPPDDRPPAAIVAAPRRFRPGEPAQVALRVFGRASAPFALYRVVSPAAHAIHLLRGGTRSLARSPLGRAIELASSAGAARLLEPLQTRRVALPRDPDARGWHAASVDLGLLPAGLYLARVTLGGWAATAVVPVGSLTLLARRGDRGDRVFVTDGEGAPIAGVRVVRRVADGPAAAVVTDGDGTGAFAASEALDADFVAARGDDVALAPVRHAHEGPCDVRTYLDAGRATFYRGDVMHLRGHLRGCTGDRDGPLVGEDVTLRRSGAAPLHVRTDRQGNFVATLEAGPVDAWVRGRAYALDVWVTDLTLPDAPAPASAPPPPAPPARTPSPSVAPAFRVEAVRALAQPGDAVPFVFDAPAEGASLVTLEQGGVLSWAFARGGGARSSLPTPHATRGYASVVASHVHEGRVETASSALWLGDSPTLDLRVSAAARVARGAPLRVTVDVRASDATPRTASLSLWVNDARWWEEGRSPRVPPDEFFRPTARTTHGGDSAAGPEPTGEEGRRHDPWITWDGARIPGLTFRHTWASRRENVELDARGSLAALAAALAAAAGLDGAEVCPERERAFRSVRLRVHDVPWDIVAERFAARAHLSFDVEGTRLVFSCTPSSGRGYGSGAGRGLRGRGVSGPTVRAAPNTPPVQPDPEAFVGLRRAEGGAATFDLTAPARPGRWRVEVLAIADDGSAASGHATFETD